METGTSVSVRSLATFREDRSMSAVSGSSFQSNGQRSEATPPWEARIPPRMVCPHCWTHFATGEVLWIAEHEDLRGDPLLGSDVPQRFLPSRFDVHGNARDARGLVCSLLACPHCHLAIPRSIVDCPPIFLSILGIPSCGKTYYLASLCWQMRQTLPGCFRLAFQDADPAANAILNHYERQQFLQADGDAPVKLEKTEEQGHLYSAVRYGNQLVLYPRPFFFTLQPLEGHPRFGEAGKVARTLCLYDNAGESFLPGRDSGANPVTRHLARSQALLFLFDPTQHPGFRKACRHHSSDPQILFPRAEVFRQDTVLLEAANRIRRLTNLKHNQRHNRPLFVLVTKFDAWRGIFDLDLSRLPLKPTGQGEMQALNWNRVAEVSQQLRDLLNQLTPEVVHAAEGLAQDVIYVPVSATGCSPVADERGHIRGIRPAQIRPIWVEVPFLAALARWSGGLIPYAIRRSAAARSSPPSPASHAHPTAAASASVTPPEAPRQEEPRG